VEPGGGGGDPTIVIDGAVADHLEILRISLRWGIGIRLIKGVGHAHAFDWLLLDTIHRIRSRDASGFEDCGNNIDDVMELGANSARVFDVAGPRNG